MGNISTLKYRQLDDGTYEVTGVNNRNITDIIIPKEYNGVPVTSIGNEAFNECKNLTYVEIPDSVTIINRGAFSKCTALTDIALPDSVTTIEAAAFSFCSSLKAITLPDSITTIKYFAFFGCTALTDIIIPKGVTIIEMFTFRDCTSLKNVKIPDTVKEIKGWSFWGCTSLPKITIPSSVEYMGKKVFLSCKNLKSVNFENTNGWHIVEKYDNEDAGDIDVTRPEIMAEFLKASRNIYSMYCADFKPKKSEAEDTEFNYSYDTDLAGVVYYPNEDNTYKVFALNSPYEPIISIPKKYKGKAVTSINEFAFRSREDLIIMQISSSVTKMGICAFDRCNNLERVIIENGISEIEYGTFAFCVKLNRISIPESVTKINNSAFSNCRELKNITIPKNVTKIGKGAFYNCNSLTEVKFENTDGWYVSKDYNAGGGIAVDLTDPVVCAQFLKDIYKEYYWFCK